jgi:hypothetical protein
MNSPTILISHAYADHDHPLFKRLSDDTLMRAQVSFHMHPQCPGQSKDDPAFSMSQHCIRTSNYFLYVISSTTAVPRYANTQPGLICASQLQLEGTGPEIISIKIEDVSLPSILEGTQCIDLTKDYEGGFRSLLRILRSPKARDDSQQVDHWMAAYYPLDVISRPRSRAIMCLLFDKVICHFPIAGTYCGGAAGVSDIVLEDDSLVEASVIEPREEILFPGVGGELSWDSAEEFEEFYRLQVTAMTMEACRSSNVVPVTDDAAWPVPARLVENLDLLRCARLQASALAIQSLEIALPPIAELPDADILKARDELSEQLVPFRRAMLALSPTVRKGIESEATLADIHRQAKYVVDTRVAPALEELRDRLAKEKGRFWRRLLLKGSAIVPQFVLNWTTKDALSAAMNVVSGAKDLTLDLIDRERLLVSLKSQGGLGYLLAVADHPSLKPS